MVQRLTTTNSNDNAHPLNVNGQSLPEAYEQLSQILRSRLGLQHAGLLAVPTDSPDGATVWTTAFEGPVVRSADLPPADRAELVKRAERLRTDIAGLARQMGEDVGASRIAAEVVARSTSVPAGDWLFSVGGRPVQVLWGHTDTPSADIVVPSRSANPPIEALLTPATPATGAGLNVAPAPTIAQATLANQPASTFQPPVPPIAPSAAAPRRSRRAWAWLLIAAMALIAMALIYVFVPVRPPDDTGAALAEADRAVQVLEDEIRKKKSNQQQYQCVPDPPAAAASEPPASLPPSPAASEPEPQPEPVPPPPAASAPASTPPLKRVAPRKVPPSPKAASQPASVPAPAEPPIAKAPPPAPAPAPAPPVACKPPSASDGDAPEVIMIIDASGSMNDRFGGSGSRLDAAKSASGGMIRSLPPAVDVGLVDFDACGHVRRDKFYSAPDRGALLGEIGRLTPRAGTPLAQAISRAGAIASGTTPSVVVVVTDGNDSCGGDPCAAAAAVHRARPNVIINVIDLSDTAEDARVLQCVASKGGGTVLRPGDPLDLNNKMKQAVGPAACAK